jgi:hypothetical protein
MNLPHVFSTPQFGQFKRVAIGMAAFTLILLVINVFVIGGDAFVYTFNASLSAPLAVIITVSAAAIWRQMSREKQYRYLWTGFVVGWALWALAELIWALYSILGQEVPYPSLADLFWMVGYIPMGIGLIARIRTMRIKPAPSQRVIIWGASAAVVLITVVFVLVPILQDFDSQRLIESILDLVYPLADLFLACIVWWMFFTYEKGFYGFGWRLLTVGFIVMTLSDLLFTYATWQGLYYPDMEANLLSRLAIDVPYVVADLIWFLGIYALRILLRTRPSIELADIQPRMVPRYGHILVYLKSDNTVISVSSNFDRFFKADSVQGRLLTDVLAMSEQDAHTLFEALRDEGRAADLPIQVRDYSDALQKIELCGVATLNPQKEYSGANILLRIPVEDMSFDETLNPYSRSMVRHLLKQSGSNYQVGIATFLSDYYLAYIKVLLELVSHEGGETMSRSLLNELLKTSQEHNWHMRFNLQTVLEGDYSLEVLREALPLLLETAQQFVSRVMDPDIVDAQMQKVSMQFSEAVRRDIARYSRAESEVRFADSRDV